ncbi:MAG: ACT domain-containing protein [Elusimicrobiaceae bacterium]|nr:ACT domain-containing protein [Elusimicrobiaceae bacterium]
MGISIVKQYSVFLINEPGALKNFTELFVRENVDIIAMAQDVRYDAAVVRLAVQQDKGISHVLTKAGFTSVKTDAICLDMPNRVGILRDVGAVMSKNGINITTFYGTADTAGTTRWIIVVNDITKALNALETSGLFQ